MRIAFFVACIIFSALGAYYGEPFMGDKTDPILVLVTVFTVFAGFLVAIITVLGDPSMLPPGSWRTAENRRDEIEARLIRHTYLLVLYLVVLVLLFVGVIAKNAPDTVISAVAKVWITRTYLFFGIASFVATFALPASLLKLQMARADADIEQRRLKDGIPCDGGHFGDEDSG